MKAVNIWICPDCGERHMEEVEGGIVIVPSDNTYGPHFEHHVEMDGELTIVKLLLSELELRAVAALLPRSN